MSEADCRR